MATAHEDVCIPFTGVYGTRFEAVGYLEKNEGSVPLREALRRAGKKVIRDDASCEELKRTIPPSELDDFKQFTTARTLSSGSCRSSSVFRLVRGGYVWGEGWCDPCAHWDRHGLVLRRR